MLTHLPSLQSVGLVALVRCVLAITTLKDFTTEDGPCLQSSNLGVLPLDGSCFFEFCGRSECYREECKPGAKTCDNKARGPNPSPGTCRKTLKSDPFPDHPEYQVNDVETFDCNEADPDTNPEPLPPVFNATVQFLGVTPPMNAVNLAAPGVNSSIPSKPRLFRSQWQRYLTSCGNIEDIF